MIRCVGHLKTEELRSCAWTRLHHDISVEDTVLLEEADACL